MEPEDFYYITELATYYILLTRELTPELLLGHRYSGNRARVKGGISMDTPTLVQSDIT